MKKLCLLFILSLATYINSQTVTRKSLDSLNYIYKQKIIELEKRIDSSEKKYTETSEKLSRRIDSLIQYKFSNFEHKQLKFEKKEKKLSSEVSQGRSYFLFIIIAIILILAILTLVYYFFHNKTKSLSSRANELDKNTEDIQVKLQHLADSTAENLLTAINQFKDFVHTSQTTAIADHTLVFEFAKQIATMENNLSRMDVDDPGIKRIRRALDKMYDSLNQVDYEVTKLMGTSLSVGKIIEIDRTELDESVQGKDRIVTNIVKCEVYYKGELIQRGRVDVKQNPNY